MRSVWIAISSKAEGNLYFGILAAFFARSRLLLRARKFPVQGAEELSGRITSEFAVG